MPSLVGLIEHSPDARVIAIDSCRRAWFIVRLVIFEQADTVGDVSRSDLEQLQVAYLAVPPIKMALANHLRLQVRQPFLFVSVNGLSNRSTCFHQTVELSYWGGTTIFLWSFGSYYSFEILGQVPVSR